MITSCSECPTPCCKTGPGPYKILPPLEYLEEWSTVNRYNTKCSQFFRGKCKIWGTKHFPAECRSHVCHLRSYTKQELAVIDCVVEEECECCGVQWLLKWEEEYGYPEIELIAYKCELCGHEKIWTSTYKLDTKRVIGEIALNAPNG